MSGRMKYFIHYDMCHEDYMEVLDTKEQAEKFIEELSDKAFVMKVIEGEEMFVKTIEVAKKVKLERTK